MLKKGVLIKDCHSPGCFRLGYQGSGSAYSKFCHLCTLWLSKYIQQRNEMPQEAVTCYSQEINHCPNAAEKNSKFCSTCTVYLIEKNQKISIAELSQCVEGKCCAPFCYNKPELEIDGFRCICVPCYVYIHKNISSWTCFYDCCVESCSNRAVTGCDRMCVGCYTYMKTVHSSILTQETSCFEILDTSGSYDVPCSFAPCSTVFCKYWVLPKENDGRCLRCYKRFVDNKHLETRMHNSSALFRPAHKCCDLKIRGLDMEPERLNR